MQSERLNSECFCITLDRDDLKKALSRELGSAELVALVEERCPYLFSSQPVFVSDRQAKEMAEVVRAVEAVVALPAYQAHVLSCSPDIARHAPNAAKGVFFGYDFHLGAAGLGVIEINTNAGGAMLNALMARAHHACCLDDERMAIAASAAAGMEENIMRMFLSEWDLAARNRPLRTIAIVDSSPSQQYLYPEFLLFQRLFERNGLTALIADPSEFTMQEGVLMCRGQAIDLVYNRLTDFYLETSETRALRSAYLENAVVLTPHPRAHALYADKRNMALLCSDDDLRRFGAPDEIRNVLLANILPTEVVKPENGERLWSARRSLFFKPAAGFGSRAAYRGDKLTKGAWKEILAGDYVAQKIMVPGQRIAGGRQDPAPLKFDIRCYAYDGKIQWTAARMYQGQTTNFRTMGGGFAPVYALPDSFMMQCISALPDSGETSSACGNNMCE